MLLPLPLVLVLLFGLALTVWTVFRYLRSVDHAASHLESHEEGGRAAFLRAQARNATVETLGVMLFTALLLYASLHDAGLLRY